MNCIVIENDLAQQNKMLEFIEKTESLNLVQSYTNSLSAIQDLPNRDIDVIFLSAEMPGMNGIEFLEEYKLSEKTKVILTATNSEYAIKAFDNGVIDYLLYPITFPRFLKAVNRVVQLTKDNSSSKEYFFIKMGKVRVRIMFNDILWIKSASEYIVIHTLQGRYMIYSSMSDILDRLPKGFVRVHRSNIVSINKIEKIHLDSIEINGQLIKISKGYKNELEEVIGS